MRIIGLTGGIASGKSLVTTMLRDLGVTVLDADEVYHGLLQDDRALLARIREAFGPGVFDEAGRLDRRKLGRIVFASPPDLARLGSITHPAVRAQMHARTETAAREGVGIVFWSVPLLFENGLDALVERVVVVWAPEKMLVKRLQARNDLDEAEALRRVRAQMSVDEKRRRADHVIDNGGAREATREQVQALWRELMEKAG